MNESMAVMAPNANSYRRYAPGFYAPAMPNWGPNHRGVAIRLPVASQENVRLEYRVAGADANPWLASAAVLAAMHHGISRQIEPPAMVPERAEVEYEPTIPLRWSLALNAWQQGQPPTSITAAADGVTTTADATIILQSTTFARKESSGANFIDRGPWIVFKVFRRENSTNAIKYGRTNNGKVG